MSICYINETISKNRGRRNDHPSRLLTHRKPGHGLIVLGELSVGTGGHLQATQLGLNI